MIRIVAKRYAKALVELSEEKKAVDKTKADLGAFIAALDSAPAMQKLFSSPVFTPENKKTVIKDLGTKIGMQQLTQRFVEHLAETGRIRYVKDVYEAFLAILAEHQNRATVELTTATTVNPAELAEIKKKLELLTGKQVDINTQLDTALIGGARARIGSMIYDGTIRNQLNKMRNQLTSDSQ
jgi:F-type H+-transporting ATPase subunit delta